MNTGRPPFFAMFFVQSGDVFVQSSCAVWVSVNHRKAMVQPWSPCVRWCSSIWAHQVLLDSDIGPLRNPGTWSIFFFFLISLLNKLEGDMMILAVCFSFHLWEVLTLFGSGLSHLLCLVCPFFFSLSPLGALPKVDRCVKIATWWTWHHHTTRLHFDRSLLRSTK